MSLKAAVIGVGSIGNNHARIYKALPDVDLVAISDNSAEIAQAIGARFNVPYETDYRTMLDTYQPDLVSISVPTVYHFEVAKEAIQRGIHVLVEKPIAATIEQAKQMISLANEAGVKLTVGHIERFNPAIIEMKKRLQADEIGTPFRVQSRRLGPFPARIRDVGVIVDLASHDVDIVRYVLNTEVTRVYAETDQGINTDREDLMDCVLRCENGVVGTLNINWLTPTKIRELTVTGTTGMFHVNYLTQELYYYENEATAADWRGVFTGVNEGAMIRHKVARREPLLAELEHFVHSVRDDTPPQISGEDGMKALALAQALVKSGEEQRIVTFAEMV